MYSRKGRSSLLCLQDFSSSSDFILENGKGTPSHIFACTRAICILYCTHIRTRTHATYGTVQCTHARVRGPPTLELLSPARKRPYKNCKGMNMRATWTMSLVHSYFLTKRSQISCKSCKSTKQLRLSISLLQYVTFLLAELAIPTRKQIFTIG